MKGRKQSLLAVVCLAAACSMGCGAKKKVARVGADTQIDLSGNWNDTDARLTSEALIRDCFAKPWLKKFSGGEGRAPKMRVRKISDKTGEHIDAQVFVKNIERAMVNSGDVEVVAQTGSELDSVADEQDYGASGRVSDGSAPSIGNEEGADFVLVGRIACIVDQGDDQASKFYKITFELINATSAKKVWIGDHEIKKLVAHADARSCPGPEAEPAKVAVKPSSKPAAGGGEQQPFVDEDGSKIKLTVVKGPPGVVGCADGEREAFANLAAFPTIAGCLAVWNGRVSMRKAATGSACGDDIGPCTAPTDACGPAWHVCGTSGHLSDLAQRVSAPQCETAAAGGSFIGAMSHCQTQSGCNYGPADLNARKYSCFKNGWCSEAVCCGPRCGTGACPDAIWPGRTHIAQGTDQGCNAVSAKRAGGVLCCKDD